jgi:hypothetical protein
MKKMKKSIYKLLSLVLAVALFISCSKIDDFGDTNTNPAATNTPNTAALLTQVLGTGTGTTGYGAFANAWAGPALYCQYFSETQYPDFSCYSANLASPSSTFAGALYDLQNIIITNTDEKTKGAASLNGANENQIAIARILKAYIFWTITDRWGDIPYTDALKGDPNVKYDSQETIYKALIAELTESVGQFTTGAPIKGDIAYDGNTAKWQKLANSLRMLMALRLSKVYPGASEYAATEFKAALADAAGHIATNADNFQLNFPGGNFRNPYYNMYDGRKDYGESETMTALLGTLTGDSRINVFGATSTGASSAQGVPYGYKRETVTAWTSSNPNYAYVFNPTYRKETSPQYIIKASSVLLARAEAADRGWTSETADTRTLYNAGIAASFQQWGLAVPDPTYFTGPNVDLTAAFGTGANVAKIALQQWVAYYPDGNQGWANWRRTNVPALLPAPDASNDPKEIPRRYMYGTSDYSLTKTGVEAAVANIQPAGVGDKMNGRVWWDKQ